MDAIPRLTNILEWTQNQGIIGAFVAAFVVVVAIAVAMKTQTLSPAVVMAVVVLSIRTVIRCRIFSRRRRVGEDRGRGWRRRGRGCGGDGLACPQFLLDHGINPVFDFEKGGGDKQIILTDQG